MKDPYEAVLTDLRNKRRQIEAAIVALEAIQRGQEAPSARPHSAPRATRRDKAVGHVNASGATDRLPIAEAAVRILQQHGRPMSNDELVMAVQDFGIVMQSKDDRNTMGALIRRRADQVGDVVKASRGMWALTEWSSEGGSTRIEEQTEAGPGPSTAGTLDEDVPDIDQTHKHV